MEKNTLQINEFVINETFVSTNNILDEFRISHPVYFYRYWIGLRQFQIMF
jgi:hypothetical protein